jgi:hypothetical protein
VLVTDVLRSGSVTEALRAPAVRLASEDPTGICRELVPSHALAMLMAVPNESLAPTWRDL